MHWPFAVTCRVCFTTPSGITGEETHPAKNTATSGSSFLINPVGTFASASLARACHRRCDLLGAIGIQRSCVISQRDRVRWIVPRHATDGGHQLVITRTGSRPQLFPLLRVQPLPCRRSRATGITPHLETHAACHKRHDKKKHCATRRSSFQLASKLMNHGIGRRGNTSQAVCNRLRLELRSHHTVRFCVHLRRSGGGGGIRTHGDFRLSGFQDRCNKPLYHPSLSPQNISTSACWQAGGSYGLHCTRKAPCFSGIYLPSPRVVAICNYCFALAISKCTWSNH